MNSVIVAKEECTVCENGIPIYHYGNKALHSFCICLYIKAGPLYETECQNGVTHLWEHALFRKLNSLYKGEFYRRLDSLGLAFSAGTYREFVSVKIKGAVNLFEQASGIISQVFEPMHLTAQELALEKKRIKAEIREADEKASLDYFSQQIIWRDTPLENTILGKHKVLDRVGVRALAAIQSEILSAGNVFAYVTGCFDSRDIAYLKSSFEQYSLAKDLPKKQNIAPVPAVFFHRKGHVAVKNSSYHYIRFSFDIDTTRHRHAELDLLYDILFSGDMAKIHQELSEKEGYIYGYDARLERYCNVGNLFFSLEVQKKHIFPVIECVVALLNGVKRSVAQELPLVLPSYVQNMEMFLDSDEDLNLDMAYECHILNCPYQSIYEKKRAYEAVSSERIQQIAGEIFVPSNATLTIKTNKKGFDVGRASALLQGLQSPLD